MAVIERDALIVNPLGMHVRPGAEFVKTANKFKSAVEVHKDGAVVNGKSILGMMTLAAECGSSIRIRTDELRTVREAMRDFGSLLAELEEGEVEKLVLTQRNRVRAVVVSVERWSRLERELAERG